MESWKILEMLKELGENEVITSIKVTDDDELELTDENGETFWLIRF